MADVESVVTESYEAGIFHLVDVIGMGFYSSGYAHDIPAVLKGLKEKGKKVKFLVGGIIPSDEIESLKEMGVDAIFGPDTPTEDVIKYLNT